jgi:hypothetical protein
MEAAVANGDAIADAARKVAAANAKARAELEMPNPAKRGPLGRALKLVGGRAGAAASAIEKKTGMDQGQLADAAGAVADVGGAMAAKTPGVAMIQAMRHQQEKDREQARAALADREARSAAVFQMLAKGGIAEAPSAATPTNTENGVPALGLPVAPNADKELADLLARLERVRQQGAAGDTVAAARSARAQLEINDAAATLATVPMRKQRQATKEALRAAVACAEGGHCRHDRR